jgi:hypothetical protein
MTRVVAASKRCVIAKACIGCTAEVKSSGHGAGSRLGQIDGETVELPIQTDRELRSRA